MTGITLPLYYLSFTVDSRNVEIPWTRSHVASLVMEHDAPESNFRLTDCPLATVQHIQFGLRALISRTQMKFSSNGELAFGPYI